jgi:hypothetical protein
VSLKNDKVIVDLEKENKFTLMLLSEGKQARERKIIFLYSRDNKVNMLQNTRKARQNHHI